MAREVILPRVDMDMATGKMGRWFVAEGERVREGQPLFEIETDKAAMEIEAPASGVLRGVRAKAGDALPVGAVVGWIVGEDEAFDPDLQALAGELRALLGSAAAPAEPARTKSAARQGRATPLARRLARERGLGLADVAGSGPGGRVQALDVTLYERPARAGPSLGSAEAARLNRLWLQKGEGAPLVFIHGFGADLNGWRPLLAHSAGAAPCARARSARPWRLAAGGGLLILRARRRGARGARATKGSAPPISSAIRSAARSRRRWPPSEAATRPAFARFR